MGDGMRGFAGIGLVSPKTSANVGAAIRASQVYGAAFMAIENSRCVRASTDAMKGYRHVPVFRGDLRSMIPFDCVPVAVDLITGAESLIEYKHPERAFYIFGPEDGTLGTRHTEWCRDIIYIPTSRCMNLAATVNVVLYDRLAKQ